MKGDFDKNYKPIINKALDKQFTDEDLNAELTEILPKIESLFTRKMGNSFNYLTGMKDPGVVDIHYYPALERLFLLDGSCESVELFELSATMPTVHAWITRMRAHPVIKKHTLSQGTVLRYFQASKEKGGPADLTLDLMHE